jgi:hypothetical protein
VRTIWTGRVAQVAGKYGASYAVVNFVRKIVTR